MSGECVTVGTMFLSSFAGADSAAASLTSASTLAFRDCRTVVCIEVDQCLSRYKLLLNLYMLGLHRRIAPPQIPRLCMSLEMRDPVTT